MLALSATASFLSALLLFLLQPMFARMVLPRLGGAPAVWSTAMVCYQVTLLLGYGYAHLATGCLGARRQALLHVVLLGAAALALPIAIPARVTPPVEASPIPWLLWLFAVSAAVPFFALSATGPVLQAWLASSGHPRARDPYPLYAVGNLGSVLALLAYPLVVERWLALADQSRAWASGYLALWLLVGATAVALFRSSRPADSRVATIEPRPSGSDGAGGEPGAGNAATGTGPDAASGALTAARRVRWALLAFVPSSLVLSVTTVLSTDLAPVPLLWVVPLALYLVTWSVAFARRPPLPHRLAVEALPLAVLSAVLVLVSRAREPLLLVGPLHLAAFGVAALVCHGELARDRPHPRYLTEFYGWVAVGGALGGAFTALVAPRVFSSVVEYPLVLVLATLLPARPGTAWEGRRQRVLDFALPLALGSLTAVLVHGLAPRSGTPSSAPGLLLGAALLVVLAFSRRPLRFALGLAVLLVVGGLRPGREGRLLYTERSFFGISRVTVDPTGRYRLLLHGTTLHGMQALDPERRREPLAYFARTGPLGDLFGAIGGTARTRAVAVVGLGAGSLACYGRPGEHWTFYEIDPVVVRIAAESGYFTFLRDCPPEHRVVLGDARLMLAQAPDQGYGLIVLDAYSSDAPPMHLLTLEAVRLYVRKLAPGGVLTFNVSNRHLDLVPVLAAVGQAAGLSTRARADAAVTPAERERGKTESRWLVMTRRGEDLVALDRDARWQPARGRPGAAPWTDDRASLLDAWAWPEARPGAPGTARPAEPGSNGLAGLAGKRVGLAAGQAE
jgi:hypothetical protein